ncbi:MAG: ChbG/HpnK family deacetylase [Gammaproteobacteria bacterium]|nr:MAG: ChbG/HpnK family deacetylase [Gammaproteobacteria bacterium]
MNRKLIINADDFGWSRKVTDQIIECHTNGIITSTTMMVNMPGTDYAASKVNEYPNLSVGLHLNLTEGTPLSEPNAIPDLINEGGVFPGHKQQQHNIVKTSKFDAQIELEVDAQLSKFADFGITPTHCDSHHGIHKAPAVQRALIKLLPKYGVRKIRTPLSYHRIRRDVQIFKGIIPCLMKNGIRLPAIFMHYLSHRRLNNAGLKTPDWKATRYMGLPTNPDSKSEIIACIAATPEGVSEILLHPGNYEESENPSDWHLKTWEADTPICLDEDVKAFIKNTGIQLISYKELGEL